MRHQQTAGLCSGCLCAHLHTAFEGCAWNEAALLHKAESLCAFACKRLYAWWPILAGGVWSARVKVVAVLWAATLLRGFVQQECGRSTGFFRHLWPVDMPCEV
jgi:hypothetical protein